MTNQFEAELYFYYAGGLDGAGDFAAGQWVPGGRGLTAGDLAEAVVSGLITGRVPGVSGVGLGTLTTAGIGADPGLSGPNVVQVSN